VNNFADGLYFYIKVMQIISLNLVLLLSTNIEQLPKLTLSNTFVKLIIYLEK